MKYINGNDILPEELLNEIRKYAQGVYVYIPKSTSKKVAWGEKTKYHLEMALRNQHIYDKYLGGIDIEVIAKCYHLSDKSIHRIILNQKRKMEPIKMNMKEIANEWAMNTEKDCMPIQIYHSTWEINTDYVLKVYDEQSALLRNLAMMTTLGEAGIPVPKIMPLPDGMEYLQQGDKCYVLTTKLKGKAIVKLNECDSQWFCEMGSIIAQLHVAFQSCAEKISYWHNSMLEEMEGWVSQNLLKYRPSYLNLDRVNSDIVALRQVYVDLPKQLIHRDVHLGNFLFDQGLFSGYIDFDLSQSNIRIFDVCYFLLGILMQEDNHRVEPSRWFDIVQQVVKGYDAVMEISQKEKNAIVCVMKNIELLFVAYFLGIGDEKSAKDSAWIYDFIRENEEKIQALHLIE